VDSTTAQQLATCDNKQLRPKTTQLDQRHFLVSSKTVSRPHLYFI